MRPLRRPLLLLILALAGTAGPGAQEAERAELDRIQAELEDRAERQRALAEQAEAAGKEAEALARRLSALASDTQATEERVARLENEVAALKLAEREKADALAADRKRLSRTLAALQRLSQRPPQTALLAPGDAVDVVRSGVVLAQLTPQLRLRADAAARAVEDLRRVRQSLADQRDSLDRELAALAQQQTRLTALIAERRRERAQFSDAAQQEADRMRRLADKAKSLEALVASLEREAADRQRLLSEALARGAAPKPAPDRRLDGLPDPETALPLPARGRVVRRFGEEEVAGAAKGLTIATRPRAQVIVPFDGRVVFAGPFRNYGLLLIIEHGDDYHSLLAGLGQIYVDVGQWVLAGEPVGIMADTRQAAVGERELTVPELYLELRRQGRPVDPLPWLSSGIQEVG